MFVLGRISSLACSGAEPACSTTADTNKQGCLFYQSHEQARLLILPRMNKQARRKFYPE
ncbi:MAG: hypothetical protein ACPGWR_23550 [Ardenticatenaceae bacterium]